MELPHGDKDCKHELVRKGRHIPITGVYGILVECKKCGGFYYEK